jgi:coenzyme F420-reducing hydrogenase delta subunit
VGLEPERLHFSWISSAEGEKFALFAAEVIDRVRALGPVRRFVKDALEIHGGGAE